MEAIWRDLSRDSNFASPDWHRFFLSSRQAQKTVSEQKPIDWPDAKKQIFKNYYLYRQ